MAFSLSGQSANRIMSRDAGSRRPGQEGRWFHVFLNAETTTMIAVGVFCSLRIRVLGAVTELQWLWTAAATPAAVHVSAFYRGDGRCDEVVISLGCGIGIAQPRQAAATWTIVKRSTVS